jgi:uncharacterized membrane protein YkoI
MSKRLIIGCTGFVAMAACASSTMAAPGLERVLARQPAAVQRAIRAQVGDGRLRSISKDDEDGDISYDVEMVRQGRTRNFTVGADGELLEAEVFLEELPATAQQMIKKMVGNSTLGEIDRSGSDGETSYDVEMIGGGKTRTFSVDATGKLTDEEIFLNELPEAFRNSIRKEIAGAALDQITRSFDSGAVFVDVDVLENGQTRTFTFDPKGVLLSKQEDIALSAVPDPAQKQIQTLSTTGKLVTIEKVTEDDTTSFDVDIRQNGKVKSYTMDASGKLLASDAN